MSDVFHYCVKIIGTGKSNQNIVRQVHDFKGKFSSVAGTKGFLTEKFSEHIPDDINFTLGYLEGRQSKKRWLYSNEDLEVMYKVFKKRDEITLRCEKSSPK